MFARKLRGWNTRKIGLLFLCLLLMPAVLFAQAFPTKPINILVTFRAGGATDSFARLLAKPAEKLLGQSIVVSNNDGGGGSVGAGIGAKQKPDGYHLVATATTVITLNPQLMKLSYTYKDFTPIMQFAEPIGGIFVRADSPWKTLKEFVEYAKKNPGQVTYSTQGTGTSPHIAMENIALKEGIQWTHVPNPDANSMLLGGHVTAIAFSIAGFPFVKEGKFRLLAIRGQKRAKGFPEVPTVHELGYEVGELSTYFIVGPKGVPQPIVKKLDQAFHKAAETPEFLQFCDKMDVLPIQRNSEELGKYLEESNARLGKLIIDLKIPREGQKN